ncbi:hypothetical protein VTN02DRAFT_47 [Thermoascus thermophilus]
MTLGPSLPYLFSSTSSLLCRLPPRWKKKRFWADSNCGPTSCQDTFSAPSQHCNLIPRSRSLQLLVLP